MKLPLSSEEEREAIMQLEQAIATDSVTAGTLASRYNFSPTEPRRFSS